MQIRVTSALLESNENRNHDSAMLGGGEWESCLWHEDEKISWNVGFLIGRSFGQGKWSRDLHLFFSFLFRFRLRACGCNNIINLPPWIESYLLPGSASFRHRRPGAPSPPSCAQTSGPSWKSSTAVRRTFVGGRFVRGSAAPGGSRTHLYLSARRGIQEDSRWRQVRALWSKMEISTE